MSKQLYTCEYVENVFINEKSNEYKKYCAFGKTRSVDKENLIRKFYDNHLFRKSLTCQISDKGESIVVVLMNPSFADEKNLDKTLNNVKKYLEQRNYAKFEVLNIFPIRMPNSNNVADLMNEYDENRRYQNENNEYIKRVLENNTNKNVLIAWGSKYHKQAQWLLEFLENQKKNLYVYKPLNKDSSPSHFAPQVYNKYNKDNPNSDIVPIKIRKEKNNRFIIYENKTNKLCPNLT